MLAWVAGQMRGPPRPGKITEQDFSRRWSIYCRQWIFTAACLFVGAAVAAAIERVVIIPAECAARDLRLVNSQEQHGQAQDLASGKSSRSVLHSDAGMSNVCPSPH